MIDVISTKRRGFGRRANMKKRIGGRRAWLGIAAFVGVTNWGVAAWRHRSVAPDMARQSVERAHTPRGMVYVPGGTCLIGTNDLDADEDVRPLRRVDVPSFYMDRTEVTNAEYKRFQPDYDFPHNEANLPVTNVTYDEAAAYARWAGKRLPTNDEWEKAARGTDGRRYPWGNVWNPAFVATRAGGGKTPTQRVSIVKKPGQCAVGASRVRPVGSVPVGVSPYGCLDMSGNAWEWVQGFHDNNPQMRLLRGGAVGYGESDLRTYTYAIEGAEAT